MDLDWRNSLVESKLIFFLIDVALGVAVVLALPSYFLVRTEVKKMIALKCVFSVLTARSLV